MKKEITLQSTVLCEQHEAYRNFVKNTELLIENLKLGFTLEFLKYNCDFICQKEGENDCEAKDCNILTWVKLLANFKSLIPDEDVVQFLTYIISGNGNMFTTKPQSSLHRWTLQKFNPSYKNFEKAKEQIITHLSSGKAFIDFADKNDAYTNLLSNFLWEADSLGIIPGGNVIDFLNFI